MNGSEWIRLGVETGIFLTLWIVSMFVVNFFVKKEARVHFVNVWVFTTLFIIAMILEWFVPQIKEVVSYFTLPVLILVAINFYYYKRLSRKLIKRKEY